MKIQPLPARWLTESARAFLLTAVTIVASLVVASTLSFGVHVLHVAVADSDVGAVPEIVD